MSGRGLLTALRSRWVVVAGLVGVGALIVAVDPVKVARALGGANAGALAAMIPVVLLLYFFHGVAWWIALRGVGANVGLSRAMRVTFISQAFDMLPGGDLWRVPILRPKSGEKLEPGVVAAAVVFDDLAYFLVLSLTMVPAAISYPFVRAPLAIALAPQLAIFTVLLWPAAYDALVRRVLRVRFLSRFEPQLAWLGPSIRRLVKPRISLPIVLIDAICSGLAIGLYGLAVVAVHATGVGIAQIAFTYASGQVISGLTVLPGALGAYEGMMTGLLAVQGVAVATAAAAALLYRAVNDLLMALLGLLVAFITATRRLPIAVPVPQTLD